MTTDLTPAQALILQHPRSAPSAEVIKAAKRAGFSLSANYIYSVRSDKRFKDRLPAAPANGAAKSGGGGAHSEPRGARIIRALSVLVEERVVTLAEAWAFLEQAHGAES